MRGATLAAPLVAAALIRPGRAAITAVACAGLGFVLAPVYPMLIAETPSRVGREHAAHAVGFQVAAASLGAVALPSLAGVLARQAGLELVVPFLAVVGLALLLLHELALRVTRA